VSVISVSGQQRPVNHGTADWPSRCPARRAVAVAPQLVRGNSCGHDFDFHLVSWSIAFKAGITASHIRTGRPARITAPVSALRLLPSTDLDAGRGAGAGDAVDSCTDCVDLCAVGRNRVEHTRAGTPGAGRVRGNPGCCAALFSGYALFTAYERTAFAELAGGTFIPLVLLFALRGRTSWDGVSPRSAWRRALDGSAVPLAIAVAATWLSNPRSG